MSRVRKIPKLVMMESCKLLVTMIEILTKIMNPLVTMLSTTTLINLLSYPLYIQPPGRNEYGKSTSKVSSSEISGNGKTDFSTQKIKKKEKKYKKI